MRQESPEKEVEAVAIGFSSKLQETVSGFSARDTGGPLCALELSGCHASMDSDWAWLEEDELGIYCNQTH